MPDRFDGNPPIILEDQALPQASRVTESRVIPVAGKESKISFRESGFKGLVRTPCTHLSHNEVFPRNLQVCPLVFKPSGRQPQGRFKNLN